MDFAHHHVRFCLCGVAKKNAQAFPSYGVSEPLSLCSECAGGNGCTETLADGFHMEALGAAGEELKAWEQLTTAPSLLIQCATTRGYFVGLLLR